jgi:hypothetical protein
VSARGETTGRQTSQRRGKEDQRSGNGYHQHGRPDTEQTKDNVRAEPPNSPIPSTQHALHPPLQTRTSRRAPPPSGECFPGTHCVKRRKGNCCSKSEEEISSSEQKQSICRREGVSRPLVRSNPAPPCTAADWTAAQRITRDRSCPEEEQSDEA